MNLYPRLWRLAEEAEPPQRYRGLIKVDYDQFRDKVSGGDLEFAGYLVSSLYSGKAWLLKGAFSPGWMTDLKANTYAWTRSRPESFHKMIDGAPDFHRMIDIETGKKYSLEGCKHSAYFFRWNHDPLGIWPAITDRWRVLKMAMGLMADEYEHNLPSDGPVDRIQVVRYPPSIGFLEPHQDPATNQRCFISGYMSRRGVDYSSGGFYFVGDNNEIIDAEPDIDVGDLCIGYATVMHGVAPCDRGKAVDWASDDGRWFLGLYSNSPDGGKRDTTKPVKLGIAEVLP